MIDASTSDGITVSSIFLSWTAASEVSSSVSYTVEWSPPSETGSSSRFGLQETFTSVTDLQSNTLYSFTVVASNDETSDETSVATSEYNERKRAFLFF